MRSWLTILLAVPIAVATTVIWMVAADQGSASASVLGLGGSAAISMLLARGGRRPAPIILDDPFRAPPGSTQPSGPRRPYMLARLAHAAYSWNLASFMGIEFFLLNGDVTATGLVLVAMVVALFAHVAQAVALPQIIGLSEEASAS